MFALNRKPDRPVVRIPADVWRPVPGDDVESFRARHKAWFASVDYGRGVELRTPDGAVFPSSAVEAIRHRRQLTATL